MNILTNKQSPFHRGEKAIQTQLGVRDRIEKFGQMVIRDYMPDQHREFYEQLPFIFLGHADPDGNPWASILYDQNQLIQSPDNQHLIINNNTMVGDPLKSTLINNHNQGIETKLGVLGIELTSRRRNRLAVHVNNYSPENFELVIDQAFGNCPKYIQSRALTFISNKEFRQKTKKITHSNKIDKNAKNLIENSDTCFIASYIENKTGHASEGADVSHRGGKPGFIKVNNDSTLTIPDYQGNYHFNTFGNILENPKTGLLFINYNTGDVLMMTGVSEIVWESEEIKNFEGAQRLLKFTISKGIFMTNALPFKWSAAELSSFL